MPRCVHGKGWRALGTAPGCAHSWTAPLLYADEFIAMMGPALRATGAHALAAPGKSQAAGMEQKPLCLLSSSSPGAAPSVPSSLSPAPLTAPHPQNSLHCRLCVLRPWEQARCLQCPVRGGQGLGCGVRECPSHLRSWLRVLSRPRILLFDHISTPPPALGRSP